MIKILRKKEETSMLLCDVPFSDYFCYKNSIYRKWTTHAKNIEYYLCICFKEGNNGPVIEELKRGTIVTDVKGINAYHFTIEETV